MRKVTEYFGQTDTYDTNIQLTIMKGSIKVLSRLVRVKTGNGKVNKMLLMKYLSDCVHCTRKLSANMGQAYNIILGQ